MAPFESIEAAALSGKSVAARSDRGVARDVQLNSQDLSSTKLTGL